MHSHTLSSLHTVIKLIDINIPLLLLLLLLLLHYALLFVDRITTHNFHLAAGRRRLRRQRYRVTIAAAAKASAQIPSKPAMWPCAVGKAQVANALHRTATWGGERGGWDGCRPEACESN